MPGNKNSGLKGKLLRWSNLMKKMKALSRRRILEDLQRLALVAKKSSIRTSNWTGESRTCKLKKASFHPSNLGKRSSELNKFYDTYLGVSLEKFPSSKFPLKRAIPQRYRSLRSKCHGMTSKCFSIYNKQRAR